MMDKVKAAIFDLGSTLYRTTRHLGDVHREFLVKIGLEKYAELTDPQLEGAQSRGPDLWLNGRMLRKNVDIYWEPSREDWIEYDRRLLEEIGVTGSLDELVEKYQQKWD